MGACNFIVFKEAETAQGAFDMLVDEARWEYGNSPYSGTIATTRLMRGNVRIADEWSEDVRELAIVEADANGWGEKWESRAIDCGATQYGRMWAFYGYAAC